MTYLEAFVVEGDFEAPFETTRASSNRPVNFSVYNSLREVLKPEYRNLSDRELRTLLQQVLGNMSPEEVEGFWDTLKDVGQAALGVAKQVAPAILPAAGGALGTLVGGPVGTAIGTKIGQMGAQMLANQPSAPAAAPPPPPVPGAISASQPAAAAQAPPGAAPIPAGSSSATAQLLALLKNPDLLKSLLGQLLGGAGESTVFLGPRATPIPFGAMMNAVESLAAHAALEAAGDWGEEASTGYLQDDSGNFLADPANPDERAQRVLELLNEAASDYGTEPFDRVTQWLIEAELL